MHFPMRLSGSAQGAPEKLSQFVHLDLCRFDITRCSRGADTGGDVIVEDFPLDPRQRGPRRLQLRQDVDAVATVVDHAGDASHLAFDPAQARDLAFVIGVFAMRAQCGLPVVPTQLQILPPQSTATIYPLVVY